MGGTYVELNQTAATINPWAKQGTYSSAFTFEDISSNQWGAAFAPSHLSTGQPLSKQLDVFFKKLGAIDPKKAPNFKALPKNEKEWEATASRWGAVGRAIGGTNPLGAPLDAWSVKYTNQRIQGSHPVTSAVKASWFWTYVFD